MRLSRLRTTRRRRNRPLVWGLYLNAALLAAVLVVLVTRDSSPRFIPMAHGQEMPPIAGGAGVFMMPGQFSSNSWGLYLMDIDQQTLCAYQWFPGDKRLRLVASRNFRYDRRLGMFNTDPSPLEVEDLTKKEHESSRVREQNTAPVEPEAPKAE